MAGTPGLTGEPGLPGPAGPASAKGEPGQPVSRMNHARNLKFNHDFQFRAVHFAVGPWANVVISVTFVKSNLERPGAVFMKILCFKIKNFIYLCLKFASNFIIILRIINYNNFL